MFVYGEIRVDCDTYSGDGVRAALGRVVDYDCDNADMSARGEPA